MKTWIVHSAGGNAMNVKALCVRQPWASMIASGLKTIETRTWRTRHRGPILIIATTMDKNARPIVPYPAGTRLPVNAAIATVVINRCRPMTKDDERAANCELYEGAIAWELSDAIRLKPVPMKGHLGVRSIPWDFDMEASQ